MYIIHCRNCGEDYQAHDRRKSDTIRCRLCHRAIQAGNVKREVIKNMNRIDDHEERITNVEQKQLTQSIEHAQLCRCPACMKKRVWPMCPIIHAVHCPCPACIKYPPVPATGFECFTAVVCLILVMGGISWLVCVVF